MKTTYDPTANAAYIQLVAEVGVGGVAKSYLCDPSCTGGMISLDFNASGHLVGIEVMDADRFLPPEMLEGMGLTRHLDPDTVARRDWRPEAPQAQVHE